MQPALSARSGVLVLVTGLALGACLPTGENAGERLFRHAEGSGGSLAYSQGPDWLARGRFGCATCHGPDGRGRQVRVGSVSGAAPPIDAASLAARGYDRQRLRRAVVDGFDPAGRPFHYYMPRWDIGDQDFAHLADYLARL